MKIAIIGCGNMGGAIAKGLSKTNQLFLYDRHIEKTEKLAHEGCGKACKGISEAVDAAEVIILAIKPQDISQLAKTLKDSLKNNQTVISLLAGVTIESLMQLFPGKSIIRMMPNLPIVCGEGVIGLSSTQIKTEEKDSFSKTFEALGKTYWIPEEKMDAFTSLSGSGPAFFYAMVEAMVDAGIAMGFTAKDSSDIVQSMLKSSLALLDKSQQHPGELKWKITSPGGTTIAGLRRLEESALRGAIMNVFLAAYERSKELSAM